MKNFSVKIGKNNLGNHLPLTLISGPCVIESKQHAIDVAGKINEICSLLGINFIYKSSFDKANRTSIKSARGLGLNKSLSIFSEIKSFSINGKLIKNKINKKKLFIIDLSKFYFKLLITMLKLRKIFRHGFCPIRNLHLRKVYLKRQ